MRSACALLGLAFLAACSADTVAIDELNARLADADCQRAVRCGTFDTMERCLAFANPHAGPIDPSTAMAVAQGFVDYDGEQAAECVDEHASRSCSPTDALSRLQPGAICLGVLRSGTKVGAGCVINAECGTRLCVPTDSCPPESCCGGTCVEQQHLASLAEDCSQVPCAPNLYCAGLCVPLLRKGVACFEAAQCDFGLDCFDTCQPPPAEGDPCPMHNGLPDCGVDERLTCDPITMTCQPPLGEGAACDPDAPRDRCAQGYLRCDRTTMTCQPFGKVGEPCTQFQYCEPGAYCSFTGEGGPVLCLPLVDDGSQCFGFSDACASGVCSQLDQVCVEPPLCT